MGWLLLFLALIAGTFFLLQGGINSNLGMFLNHLVKAAFVPFVIGTIVLFIDINYSKTMAIIFKNKQISVVDLDQWTVRCIYCY